MMHLISSHLLACLLAATAAAGPVDFESDVQPIWQRHCIRCHGPEKQESSLRLDRRSVMLRGGDYGQPSIVPGNSGESFLVRIVAGDEPDLAMPPEGERLAPDEIATLRAWIDQGAKMPAELAGDDVDRRVQAHWSFQPIRAATPPTLDNPFVANPIDAFVLRRLAEHQLQPSEQADRRTRIRRLYLVMHGLPPTPQQIRRFLDDDTADAWPRLVEEVLASPRYGERWARHWLDLIRFGETHGFETNRERPNAWPFRDYVIASLNADKPYDRFVREQLAGTVPGPVECE